MNYSKWTLRLLIGSLTISFSIIIVLLVALSVMKKRLNTVGDIVDQMAVQHIVTNVSVDQTIPLKTDITVIDNLTVGIDMFLSLIHI